MIKWLISDEMKKAVEEYCATYHPDGKNYAYHMFTSTNKEFVGVLGEVVVYDWQGLDWKEYLKYRIYDHDDGGYDITINGLNYDVKSRGTAVTPDFPQFCHSAAAEQVHRTLGKLEVYGFIFCAVLKACNCVYITGYIPKREFKEKAAYYRKGEWVVNNNFYAKCDTYNISVLDLRDPAILAAIP